MLRTDCSWLYPDALLDVRVCRVIGIEARENFLAAESVHERRTS